MAVRFGQVSKGLVRPNCSAEHRTELMFGRTLISSVGCGLYEIALSLYVLLERAEHLGDVKPLAYLLSGDDQAIERGAGA